MGWHGLARSRIRYPLLANAVQRLLTAMVGQDREEANRLQQAKWDLTSRIGMKVTFRTHSISPGDHRSSRGSGPAVPDEVLATTGLGGSARQMSASVFHPSSGRPDCVAVDAVPYELVFAAKFPDIREFTGNFLQFAGNSPLRRIKNARQIRRFTTKFPTQRNREFYLQRLGNFNASREPAHLKHRRI